MILAGPLAPTLRPAGEDDHRHAWMAVSFRLISPPLNQPLGSRECPGLDDQKPLLW